MEYAKSVKGTSVLQPTKALITAMTMAVMFGTLSLGTAWAGQVGCDGSGGSLDLSWRTIQSGGVERTYMLQVPPQHDGLKPLPLALNFHGMGSNANDADKDIGLAAHAKRNGYVLIVPQGIGNVPSWNSGGVFLEISKADDVRFVRDMLDETGTEFCIDPTRIFSMGESNGGGMSDRLGCEMPDRIVAITPVSGAYTRRPKKCSTKRLVSVLEFHGDADTMTPYIPTGPFSAFLGIPTWLNDWAKRSKCSTKVKTKKVAHNLTKKVFRKCPKGVAVVHYRVHGGVHSWFDKPIAGTEVRTTDRIWNFIKKRPRGKATSFSIKVDKPGKYVFKVSAASDKSSASKDRFTRRFKRSGPQIVRWNVPKKLRRSKQKAYTLSYNGPGDSGSVHLRIN